MDDARSRTMPDAAADGGMEAGSIEAGAGAVDAASHAQEASAESGLSASPFDARVSSPDAADVDASAPDASTRPRGMFRNPLNTEQGSDPWLVYHAGNYYLTATTWSSELVIHKAETLAGLKSATPTTVWRGDDPSRCCNFWAPELHRLDSGAGARWYLYYTAGPAGSNTDNQRNHVLESEGDDPLGPYHWKARVYDPQNDSWAIDPSVVTIEGQLYFLFSAWEGNYQNVYIAEMQNPWTLSSQRVRISRPTLGFETSLANVNEGPVALQHDGRTFITYSASACWGPDYSLGLLALTGQDPLAPASWKKSPEAVFARSDGAHVFGPGHNGFFKSPDGTEDWIVYHANDAASGVCDTRRTTRAQPIAWHDDGTPDFGTPFSLDTDILEPPGE